MNTRKKHTAKPNAMQKIDNVPNGRTSGVRIEKEGSNLDNSVVRGKVNSGQVIRGEGSGGSSMGKERAYQNEEEGTKQLYLHRARRVPDG